MSAPACPETPAPVRSDPQACAQARATLPAYLAGDLRLESLVDLRSHLSNCADCRAHLETSVGTAAKLRAQPRRERIEEERVQRRRENRRAALQGAFTMSARSPRGARMRLLLLPAFFVFLMIQTTSGSLAKVRPALTALRGEVWVDELPVLAARPQRDLRAGDYCRTAGDSGARLDLGETSVRMQARTGLWIESLAPVRLRIEGGSIDTLGPATVTSRLGLVETDQGAARISSLDGRLRVRAHGEGVRVVDSRGVRALDVGASLELGGRR